MVKFLCQVNFIKCESNPENDKKNAMMKPAIITHEYSDRDSCPWRKLIYVQRLNINLLRPLWGLIV